MVCNLVFPLQVIMRHWKKQCKFDCQCVDKIFGQQFSLLYFSRFFLEVSRIFLNSFLISGMDIMNILDIFGIYV